jgi:hypothetical protein
MDFQIDEALALLARTPSVLEALLGELPERWLNSSDEEWTACGVVGHLIHGEKTDWIPRLRIILEFGESKPFEPFDRTAHLDTLSGKPMPQLLAEFRHLRRENLNTLRSMSLTTADLARRGMHPALGTVTFAEYTASWAVHDLSHLHQLTRILAKHYGEACGPLRGYMGVLRPPSPTGKSGG